MPPKLDRFRNNATICALLLLSWKCFAADQPQSLGVDRAYPLAYEITPLRGVPAKWETAAKFSVTGATLHVEVLATDPHPDLLVAQAAKFDAVPGGDDAVTLSVVPQKGRRRAFTFRVNAAGARSDSIASTGTESAPDWNGEWSGKASRNSSGYQVVFDIPVATLGVDTRNLPGTISVNVTRQIGRGRGELVSLAKVDLNAPCIECQYLYLDVSKLAPASSGVAQNPEGEIQLQPYVIATASEESGRSSQQRLDGGIDARWQLTPRDVVVGTFNPDYAQVEIDAIQFQVNQRYVSSLPEKRQFFTNESGIFNTRMSLLYTRALLDPDYGIQYVGRREADDYGVMLVRDSATWRVQPAADYSFEVYSPASSTNLVSRYKKNWGSSYLGGFFSYRDGTEYRNAVGSVDGEWAVSPTQVASFQAATSYACDPPAQVGSTRICDDGNAAMLSHSFGGTHWYTDTQLARYSNDFRADLGSVNQVGITDFYHSNGYTSSPHSDRWIQSWTLGSIFTRQDLNDGGLLNQRAYGKASVLGAGWSALLLVDHGREVVEGTSFTTSGLQVSWSDRLSRRTSISTGFGRRQAIYYQDMTLGTQTTFNASISSKVSSKLEAFGSVSLVRFDVGDEQAFQTKVISGRLSYHLSDRHHFLALVNLGQSAIYLPEPGFDDALALYQVTYQFKPSAFRYFIAGVSGAEEGSGSLTSVKPQETFLFAKYVHELRW